MTIRRNISVFAFLAIVACATSAAASQHFPVVVQSSLGMETAPDCTLCHQTDRGGENTTTQPFGRTMQRFGAVKKNDDSVVHALQRANDELTDSDGDCIPDIDELVEKPPGDPNRRRTGGDAGVCAVPETPPVLKTGCTVSSHGRTEFVTLAYCVCSLVLVCRRARGKVVRRKTVRPRVT